jgi:hypothetical protein
MRTEVDEYARREQSDFLLDVNHDGEVLDFHCLRHTGGAGDERSTPQGCACGYASLARHSTITLTMDTYGHLVPGQEAETVARFSAMLGDVSKTLRATGTDDLIVGAPHRAQRQTQRAECEMQRDGASKFEPLKFGAARIALRSHCELPI